MTKINKLAKTLARAKTRYYRELGRIARKAAKVKAKDRDKAARKRARTNKKKSR